MAVAATEPSLGRDNKAHYSSYTVLVILFMAMGSVTFGFSAANIGITLTQPSFVNTMALNTAANATALIGGMNGTFFGGGICGAFFHGWVANRYGRKISIAIGCTFVLVSGAILTGSVNAAMFIAFRFFNGWGCFQLLGGVPLWITEIVPPKHRGMLSDIHAVGLNTGYCVSAYVGIGFFYTQGDNAFRPPIALQVVPPLVVLTGIYWMPESPRWLLSKGRVDDAWTVVHRLHVSKSDTDDSFARAEFQQMQSHITYEQSLPSSYKHIFTRPSYRKRAIMTMFLTFAMFSTGILVINSYGSLIYHSLGYGPADSLQFQAGYILCCLVFNILAMAIVDKVKRNHLISFGFFMVMICLIVETVLQRHYIGTDDQAGLIACVFVIFFFAMCFSLFLDGPCYFYIAEIWPTHLRAKGYTLGIGALAATNLLWLEAAPFAFETISWGYYIIFVVTCGISTLVAFFWFPNTLHKPLEEIASLFGDDDLAEYYRTGVPAEQNDLEQGEKSSGTESPVPAIKGQHSATLRTSEHVEAV